MAGASGAARETDEDGADPRRSPLSAVGQEEPDPNFISARHMIIFLLDAWSGGNESSLCNHADVTGIQEPHLDSVAKLSATIEFFSSRGYTLICPLTTEGRGRGGAMAVRNTWGFLSTKFLSNRLVQACLRNPDGATLFVTSVQMYHEHNEKPGQWNKLRTDSTWALPADTTFLAGFNSALLPSRDVSQHCLY